MSTVVYGLYALNGPDQIRYVGQTKQSINKRLTQHRYHSKTLMKKTPVGKWIRKHNGEIGIRVLKDKAVWNVDEINTIKEYRCNGNILNICDGGMGNQKEYLTQAHKDSISKSMSGKKKSNSHSRNIRLGKIGIKFSTEHKNKMSIAQIGNTSAKGSIRSRELREQVSKTKGSKPFKVICKKTGIVVGTWINKSECAKEINIKRTSINNVLCGYSKTTRKYDFKYL